MKRTAAAVCLCFVFGIGILFVWQNTAEQDKEEGRPCEVTAEWNGRIYSVVTDPKSDAFDDYMLEKNITSDLIGEKLGSQEIVMQNDENGTVTDTAALYRYAKAPITQIDWYPRIIIKDTKGNFYHAVTGSWFDADTQTPEEVFQVYGLNSSEDIKAVKQRKDYGSKRITEKNFIQKFYQGLITEEWGDSDFLQKNVYQNTGIDERDINKLYEQHADDAVYLVVELKNGMCLNVSFSSHPFAEVFHGLYFKVTEDQLALMSELK